MRRYLNIKNNMKILNEEKREMILLKGEMCKMHCAFCDYYLDNEKLTISEKIKFNHEIIKKVTGEHKVLSIINSASIFELPNETLKEVLRICVLKKIKIIYFESYISFSNQIPKLTQQLKKEGIEARFRLGIETFDENFRIKVLKKNISNEILEKFYKYYYGANILVGIKGQTKESILYDLKIGQEKFDKLIVCIFVNNTTKIKRDETLVKWFIKYAKEKVIGNKKIEIFLEDDVF